MDYCRMWRNVKNICKQCGGAVGLTCGCTLIILQADYNEDAPVNNKIINTTLSLQTNFISFLNNTSVRIQAQVQLK